MRISDWSSDVCSSDLATTLGSRRARTWSPGRARSGCSSDRRELDRELAAGAAVADGDLPGPRLEQAPGDGQAETAATGVAGSGDVAAERRSEEHTSELQSLMRISYAVFCLKHKQHITK